MSAAIAPNPNDPQAPLGMPARPWWIGYIRQLHLDIPLAVESGGTGKNTQLDASDIAETDALKILTADERTKLTGIAEGAEVNTVDSVAGRTGDVTLDADDVAPTSTKLWMSDTQSSKLAGIAENANNYTHPATHPQSMIEGLEDALAGKAPLANPEFTGTPKSPTLLTKPTSAALWVIYNPPGGGYVGGSGASLLSNGIIEIKLPSPGSGQAFIARMQIEVFDYQAQQSYTVITEGFWQNTNQWIRQSSQVVFPQGTVKKEVVVGHGIAADGRPVIQLETLAITRAYLRVSIPWVMITWITNPAPFLNQWAIATIRNSNPSTIHTTRTCYPGLNAETTQIINGRQFFRNAQGNVMYGPETATQHDPLVFGYGNTLAWKYRQNTNGELWFYRFDGSDYTLSATWNPTTSSLDLFNTPTAPTATAGTNTTQIASTEFVQAKAEGALLTEGTPSGPTDTGTKGMARFDADYFYVCTATNTWVRFPKDGSWT